jgi:hypothetical protein
MEAKSMTGDDISAESVGSRHLCQCIVFDRPVPAADPHSKRLPLISGGRP